MAPAEPGQLLVEEAMPCRALLRRESVAQDVRPHREDLTVDAGARHSGDPSRRLLDELGEERTHEEAVGETELLAAGLGLDHRDSEARTLGLEPPHDLPGHVMRVNVHDHGVAPCSPYSSSG